MAGVSVELICVNIIILGVLSVGRQVSVGGVHGALGLHAGGDTDHPRNTINQSIVIIWLKYSTFRPSEEKIKLKQ